MSSPLLEGLEERRALVEENLLTSTGYRLARVLVDDLGGTERETFELDPMGFPCRIQPIFRRPDMGEAGDAIMEMSDLRFVYPVWVNIDQEDRVRVNNVDYTIRNLYDNVDDAMTNQAYVAALDDA
jgi:hypothetical protein